MMTPFGVTKQGIEQQFGINHIGHFLLTTELLPILIKNKARIVNLSSAGHHFAKNGIEFDELKGSKEKYGSVRMYGISKLANILFTKELQRRYGSYGITTCSVHPGVGLFVTRSI
jgi:NAD(P)-dependent dehydrogenase (short-subunit alcohol dehydrogenase family)